MPKQTPKSFQAEGVEVQSHESVLEHDVSGRIASNSEQLDSAKNKDEKLDNTNRRVFRLC